MSFLNLYFLHKIQPLWLRKIIANIIGFLIIYPIVLYNAESALMISIFLSIFTYRRSKDNNIGNSTNNYNNLAIYSLLSSLFCACIFIFNTWQVYIIQACIACVFLRIYDFYKPSLIGKFSKFNNNIELGYILATILHGVLSGISVMILNTISIKLNLFL